MNKANACQHLLHVADDDASALAEAAKAPHTHQVVPYGPTWATITACVGYNSMEQFG